MKIEDYISNRIPSLEGKTFLITGANTGLGFSTAKILVLKGASIIMACRNLKKAETAKTELLKVNPEASIIVMQLDQADKASIKKFNQDLLVISPRIDAFIFNAGIVHPSKNIRTKDNYPLTVGTNFLGVYFLIQEMKEAIEHNLIKKFVFVTSVVQGVGKTKHCEKYFTKKCRGNFREYNVSKRMIFDYACMLEQDSEFKPEISLAHPGIANTNIIHGKDSSFGNKFQKAGQVFFNLVANPADKSALCSVLAAITPSDTANYFYPRRLFHFKGYPKEKRFNMLKRKTSYLKESLKNF